MCQHGFWVVFRLFGIKFRLFYNLFSDVKRMSNGCQTILNPFLCQSQVNQPYTNVGYSNLIYITYENNIKVVKQPFLKNTGKSMAKQWQLLFHHNEPFAPSFLFRLLESQIDSQVIHCLYLPYICSNRLRSSFHPYGRRTAP